MGEIFFKWKIKYMLLYISIFIKNRKKKFFKVGKYRFMAQLLFYMENKISTRKLLLTVFFQMLQILFWDISVYQGIRTLNVINSQGIKKIPE